MAPDLTAVTDRVHFVRTDLVNWTLVADDDGVVLIDAGFPGSRDEVLWSLNRLGFGVADLRAILLTHAHIDHFGSAIWFAKTYGTPVYCHAAEVGHARRDHLEQASPRDIAVRAWQPRYLKWAVTVMRKGGLTHEGIPTAEALSADVAAGLPGTPQVIATPGHTGGHCSYLVDGVLVSGDALVTGHPLRRVPARNCCRRSSTTTTTPAGAASRRWQPSTRRCCCPGTARCGAADGRGGPGRSNERVVAE